MTFTSFFWTQSAKFGLNCFLSLSGNFRRQKIATLGSNKDEECGGGRFFKEVVLVLGGSGRIIQNEKKMVH